MKQRIITIGGILLAMALLSGTAWAQDQALPQSTEGQDGGLWLPHGSSTYTADIDGLYRLIFWVTTVTFILVEGLLIIFCIIYRRRPGHRPAYTHGNNKAELAWTITPGVFLLFVAIMQIGTWNDIKLRFPDPSKESNITQVDVFGHQYKWGIRYPGSKKDAVTALKKVNPVLVEDIEAEFDKPEIPNDLANFGNLHMPFGNKLLAQIRSRDVIHSFFIPHMRVKQDTVPGIRQRIWFYPNRIQLIHLKEPPSVEGKVQVREGDTWVMKERQVLPFTWVTDPKAFEEGGAYYDKKIAVSAGESYAIINGLYSPLSDKHRHRVLYQGKIMATTDGDGIHEAMKVEWKDCDYALGYYEIACAELCGLGHYTMKGTLIVEPKASFEWWYGMTANDAFDAPLPKIWNAWKD